MTEIKEIRSAAAADFDQLLPIWQGLSQELPSHHFTPFGQPDPDKLCEQLSATLQGCLSREDARVMIALDSNQRIIATLSIILNKQSVYERPDSAVLFNLWVSETLRRNGIATEMLHVAKKWLKANDVTSVQAGWHPQNQAADRFWQSHGFSSYETIGACLI